MIYVQRIANHVRNEYTFGSKNQFQYSISCSWKMRRYTISKTDSSEGDTLFELSSFS